MKRPDNLPLPNLSLPKKLFISGLLLIGILIYFLTWYQVLSTVYWQDFAQPGQARKLLFGVGLGVLAWSDTDSFYRLFALHAAGIILVLTVSVSVFRLTSLRRRVKALTCMIAVLVAIIDLAGWLYAPHCSSTNRYVGIMGAISSVPLAVLALTPLSQLWWYKRWNSPTGRTERVVIIGGGFAGLYAALRLHKVLGYHKDLEIIVVDRKNYFLFPPLLPSAAAGTIETRQVSFPFRRIFETTNIIFQKLEVTAVDQEVKIVSGIVEVNESASGEVMTRELKLPFDYLVLAPGSVTQTFRTPGVEEHAFFMRELNDAILVRNHVIDCFERAAVVDDEELQRELLRFVIVGAGPTGVETATEIYDLIHAVLLKRYPEIERGLPEVLLIQSGEQILPGWNLKVVSIAEQQLRKLNITISLQARVTEVGANFVKLGAGRQIRTRTVIWCAGVRPSELLARCGLPVEKSGRVVVESTLQPSGYQHVFVLGDAAHCIDQRSGKPLPPLGQVAFQQGSHCAKNLLRLLSGLAPQPFRYFNFGSLVSVGEHFAAVHLLGLRFSGFVGWFIWRSLYLAKLVGVSNKIRVMVDWTLDLLIERSISQIREQIPKKIGLIQARSNIGR